MKDRKRKKLRQKLKTSIVSNEATKMGWTNRHMFSCLNKVKKEIEYAKKIKFVYFEAWPKTVGQHNV